MVEVRVERVRPQLSIVRQKARTCRALTDLLDDRAKKSGLSVSAACASPLNGEGPASVRGPGLQPNWEEPVRLALRY